MTIESQGYEINGAGIRWSSKGKPQRTGNRDRVNQHAEQLAYGFLRGAGPYLLVQNAFPCDGCDAFFIGSSKKGHAIIIHVEADEGGYAATLGLAGAPLPTTLYYFNGARTVVNAAGGAPPADFPAHPAIDNR